MRSKQRPRQSHELKHRNMKPHQIRQGCQGRTLTIFNIDDYNNKWSCKYDIWYLISANIRMSSEGSCDTEDLSNDADNSALIKGINNILL